jgi:CheY-like chemotaxis protein
MSLGKPKLLVVEDDPSTRSSLDRVFREIGYDVKSAQDGLSALAAIREQVPDIVLADLNMPRMSGFELLSVVSRRFPDVRAIAMSGAFSGNAVPPGVSADAFYEKGSGMEALLRAVEAARVRKYAPADRCRPIWIQKSGQNALSDESVMVACPECFRTFPQAVSGTAGMILDTSCIYCGGPILYAVVEPMRPSAPLADFPSAPTVVQ